VAEVGVVLFSPVVLRCKTGGSVVEDVFVVEPKFPVRVIVSSKRDCVCKVLKSVQFCASCVYSSVLKSVPGRCARSGASVSVSFRCGCATYGRRHHCPRNVGGICRRFVQIITTCGRRCSVLKTVSVVQQWESQSGAGPAAS
jgi:hypothetical protein